MNKWIKKAAILAMTTASVMVLVACDDTQAITTARDEVRATRNLADKFADSQQTPTDIDYSLERYNLIRRAYWVNGQREKAIQLPSKIEKPMGYILLMNGSAVVGTFTVDGKVSSLNSFLTPDTDSPNHEYADWLPDVDGSYGENDNGIFFFTPDGKYLEWTGEYLYSDIPFDVPSAIVNVN